MTGQPLRPEEERSLHDPTPELLMPPPARGPLDRAQALVTRWENELATVSPSGDMFARIRLTNDVKDRLRDDIAALLNDQISRGHNA